MRIAAPVRTNTLSAIRRYRYSTARRSSRCTSPDTVYAGIAPGLLAGGGVVDRDAAGSAPGRGGWLVESSDIAQLRTDGLTIRHGRRQHAVRCRGRGHGHRLLRRRRADETGERG